MIGFGMHNTSYKVTVQWQYTVYMKGPRGPFQTSITINVQNLVVTSEDVGKVLKWDPERPELCDTSFGYSITCAQKKQVQVTISIYSMDGQKVYELTEQKLCPGSYSFTWDGTVNTGDYEGMPEGEEPTNIAPAGLYTFDVEVTRVAPYDHDCVRSKELKVVPGPVEYYGYDDGGTPEDESDDNYLYYLRWYALYSGRDATWGEIWLYDPDFERVSEWAVPMLECVVHGWNDGLDADPNGEVHGVIIPVPVSVMDKAGTYRFVLHFYDDYADSYKNHQVKAALEVNQTTRPLPPIVYISGTYTTRNIRWHGAWCRIPSRVQKRTRYLTPWQTVINWIINNTPDGSGIVRAGVNGGFFGDSTLIGHVGTGAGWPGNNMLIKRWNFGMELTGSHRFIDRMVLAPGTRSTYTLHPNVRNFPYGLSGIGVLIWGGRGRTLDDDNDGRPDEDDLDDPNKDRHYTDSEQVDNDGDGLINEDPDWPYTRSGITTRPRTAIAWDDRGHFYLIVFEGDGNQGVTWQETVDFFRTELPRWMRDDLPNFVANEPAYEGARVSPQNITIQDAIMLDGGSSTQFIWRWARTIRRAGRYVTHERSYTVTGAKVPTMVDVYAFAP